MALWKTSGQTAATFAAAHGFSARSLLWWSPTLRRDMPDGKPVAFAPLVASPPRAAAVQAFELVLRSGLVVRTREGSRVAQSVGVAMWFAPNARVFVALGAVEWRLCSGEVAITTAAHFARLRRPKVSLT